MKGTLLVILGAALVAVARANAGTVDVRAVDGRSAIPVRAGFLVVVTSTGTACHPPGRGGTGGAEARSLADVSGMGVVVVVVPMASGTSRGDSFVSLCPQFNGAPSASVQIDEWLSRKHVPLPHAGLAGLVTLGGIVLARHRRLRR